MERRKFLRAMGLFAVLPAIPDNNQITPPPANEPSFVKNENGDYVLKGNVIIEGELDVFANKNAPDVPTLKVMGNHSSHNSQMTIYNRETPQPRRYNVLISDTAWTTKL
jgi:hypothetical protein